jgi:hypothetical protein
MCSYDSRTTMKRGDHKAVDYWYDIMDSLFYFNLTLPIDVECISAKIWEVLDELK